MGHFCQTQLAGEIDEGSLRERTDTVRMRDQSPFPAAVSTFNNSTSWLKHLVDTSISAWFHHPVLCFAITFQQSVNLTGKQLQPGSATHIKWDSSSRPTSLSKYWDAPILTARTEPTAVAAPYTVLAGIWMNLEIWIDAFVHLRSPDGDLASRMHNAFPIFTCKLSGPGKKHSPQREISPKASRLPATSRHHRSCQIQSNARWPSRGWFVAKTLVRLTIPYRSTQNDSSPSQCSRRPLYLHQWRKILAVGKSLARRAWYPSSGPKPFPTRLSQVPSYMTIIISTRCWAFK